MLPWAERIIAYDSSVGMRQSQLKSLSCVMLPLKWS